VNAEVLKSHIEVIYGRCHRLLRDEDLAWDALQEVMMRYYEVNAKQEIQQPLHYLYRICTNYCLKKMRTLKRSIPIEPREFDTFLGSVAQTAEHKVLLDELFQAFEEEEINLLLYRHVDQMTYKEIASMYGRTDRGIKKKLDKIEQRIRKYAEK